MKFNTKLAVTLFVSASSLFGLASTAFAGPVGVSSVEKGNPEAYNSRNAAAAATFTQIDVGAANLVTGAASAAIGKTSAAATATTATNVSIGGGFGGEGFGLSGQAGSVNSATAIGSDSDITVSVGGTGSGFGATGTGEMKLNSY